LVAVSALAADSDREIARGLIDEVKKDAGSAKLARDPIEKAEHALRRGNDARAAGDHLHGTLLESLGRTWAETGRDLVSAARTERKLQEVSKQQTEAETRLLRARALLEETVARAGRARQRIEQLEKERSGGKP
jgi:hypothetical protein